MDKGKHIQLMGSTLRPFVSECFAGLEGVEQQAAEHGLACAIARLIVDHGEIVRRQVRADLTPPDMVQRR